MKIVIIDYKMGNLRSVQKAFTRCGFDAEISSNLKVIKSADRLILPGVGHFNTAMESLKKLNMIEVLKEQISIKKIPTLGICLGMQLLTNFSEEGSVSGLGVINADTLRFPNPINSNLQVPHIGWNEVRPVVNSVIFNNTLQADLFYFVHSYYVKCKEAENILTTTNYGIEFHSSIIHENVIGMQFHPEKSHKYGLNLISNFIKKL